MSASPCSDAIVQVGVLPDRGYSWERIRTGSVPAFAPADSLRPAQARRYWLRLTLCNPSRYAAPCRLTVLPNLANTLFYFDEDVRAWRTRRAGLAVPVDSNRVKGQLPLRVPGGTSTVYVRVDLGRRAALPPAIRLQARVEGEAAAHEKDLFFVVAGAVSLSVLGLLFLVNLYGYYRFRDRTQWFYLCTQLGSMGYITAYRGFPRMLLPAPVFSLLVLPDGTAHGYGLGNLLMHLSVVLLLTGFVQMTRAYLQTPKRLPRLDAALRYALRCYLGFSVAVAAVNLGGFYLDNYSLRYDNLLVLGVIVLLLVTMGRACRYRIPAARPYLVANALPLVLMLALTAYHLTVGFTYNGNLLLPDLVIISHTICFSVAIGSRVQALRENLRAKEQEAHDLIQDIRQQETRFQEIKRENHRIETTLRETERQRHAQEQAAQQLSADNQHHQTTNQDLQQQLEANQRELASTTLYVAQKNALLAELKQQINDLNTRSPHRQNELSGLQSLLQTSLYLDEDWNKFKRHFEQVHPRFFEELQARCPALTPYEQRLYSYFHLKLSTKEIAALLNIEPASVRQAKTRLYKKIAAANGLVGRPPAEETDGPLAGG